MEQLSNYVFSGACTDGATLLPVTGCEVALTALMRLVLVAVRVPATKLDAVTWQHDGAGAEHDLYRLVHNAGLAGVALISKWQYSPQGAAVLLGVSALRQLLRMQTLEACSVQLARIATALQPVLAGADPTQEQPLQPTQHCSVYARRIRGQCMSLFYRLAFFLPVELAATAINLVERTTFKPDDTVLSYTTELSAAYASSRVLEHGARAALLLERSQVPDHQQATQAFAQRFGMWWLELFYAVERLCNPFRGSPNWFLTRPKPTVGPLLEMLSDAPCTWAAGLCHGVATLCAADGGPAYGLPHELLARIPALRSLQPQEGQAPATAVALSGGGEGGRLPTPLHLMPLRVLLSLLSRSDVAPPWLSRRATIQLLLRTCHVATASERARLGFAADLGCNEFSSGGAASASQPPAAGPSRGIRRLLEAAPEGICEVAVPALLRAAIFMGLGASAEQWAEWWRLAVGLLQAAARERMDGGRSTMMAALFRRLWFEGVYDLRASPWLLPTVPLPPRLVAALTAGFLPALEMVLRRSPMSSASTAWLSEVRVHHVLSYLLAAGDQRQAAALITTLGKLMLKADPRVIDAEPKGDCLGASATMVVATCLSMWRQYVADADAAGEPEPPPSLLPQAPPRPQQQPTGPEQVMLLMSHAVGECLSPLAHCVQWSLRRGLGRADGDRVSAWPSGLHVVLGYVDALALRCARDDAATAAASSAAATGAALQREAAAAAATSASAPEVAAAADGRQEQEAADGGEDREAAARDTARPGHGFAASADAQCATAATAAATAAVADGARGGGSIWRQLAMQQIPAVALLDDVIRSFLQSLPESCDGGLQQRLLRRALLHRRRGRRATAAGAPDPAAMAAGGAPPSGLHPAAV
ncbi:hypothetical protein PLESTB_001063400 [Pleodorina starrii]|uniref:Uncharacterized protein n=1 Tax=Pleodorina starrii TaxID=330485 RepID=A0A9W6BR96_9CHLO|nr:hypothetical protein PLESTM_001281300 [Pleodorina starrii]GLC56091.1 hypothetical protein PLESTB_001063400 [Pleodorina starrii]GLC64075.1 hypothetical protein PLESTF_000115500 [Pleodorina starrii]